MKESVTNLVGIHGKLQVGKGTVAHILAEEFGFEDWQFSKPVKEALLKMNPWVLVTIECHKKLNHPDWIFPGNFYKVFDLVDALGWEEAKKVADIRDGLQRIGTDVGRAYFGVDCWVNQAETRMRKYDVERTNDLMCQANIAFSDVRFSNELDFIAEFDGVSIKVAGPQRTASTTEATKHSSEVGLPDELFHFVIYNTGTIDELRDHVVNAMTQDIPHETIYLGVQQ